MNISEMTDAPLLRAYSDQHIEKPRLEAIISNVRVGSPGLTDMRANVRDQFAPPAHQSAIHISAEQPSSEPWTARPAPMNPTRVVGMAQALQFDELLLRSDRVVQGAPPLPSLRLDPFASTGVGGPPPPPSRLDLFALAGTSAPLTTGAPISNFTTRLLTAVAIGLSGLGAYVATTSRCPLKPTLPHLFGAFLGFALLDLPEQAPVGTNGHLITWGIRQFGFGMIAVLSSAVLCGLSPQVMGVSALMTLGVLGASLIVTSAMGKSNFNRINTDYRASSLNKPFGAMDIATIGLNVLFLRADALKLSPARKNTIASLMFSLMAAKLGSKVFSESGSNLSWPQEDMSFFQSLKAANATAESVRTCFSIAIQIASVSLGIPYRLR